MSGLAFDLGDMLNHGFIEEVRSLYGRGDLSPALPSIKRWVSTGLGIPGRQYDYDTLIEKGCAATRQLARRQLTWLRSWPDVVWIPGGERLNEGVSETASGIDSIANK